MSLHHSTQARRFVCLDDIIGVVHGINPVIYNPLLSKERNEELLLKYSKEYFHRPLTDEELDILTSYSDLNCFIDKFVEFMFDR